MSERSTQPLAIVETLTPDQVYAQPGQAVTILTKVHAEVAALNTADATTPAGIAAIKSLAFKIARTKTLLDGMGKALVDEAKARTAKIDAVRKDIRDNLEKLKDDVRRPVTEMEEREAKRVLAHNDAVRAMEDLRLQPWGDHTAEFIEGRLNELERLRQRDWQEFSGHAAKVAQQIREYLEELLRKARESEARDAELERLRQAGTIKLAGKAAVTAERKRVADEKKAEAERLAKNREKIDSRIIAALVKHKMNPRAAKGLVELIHAGKIPHLAITA